jgi:hypothetical protein
MVMEVKLVEDCLSYEYNAPLIRTNVGSDVRLSIMWLSHVLGSHQIKRMLEQKPIAFIVAIAAVFVSRNAWMEEDSVNTRLYLLAFFNAMITMHEQFYNPEFVQWATTGNKEAAVLVTNRAIGEIAACELPDPQRQELIMHTRESVDRFLSLAAI